MCVGLMTQPLWDAVSSGEARRRAAPAQSPMTQPIGGGRTVKGQCRAGHGTTVRVYLPRSRMRENGQVEIAGVPVVRGSEVILLVEEDGNVRGTTAEMLSDLGYRVLRARDAEAAMTIIESGASIDLLFTDVVMPVPVRSRDYLIAAYVVCPFPDRRLRNRLRRR